MTYLGPEARPTAAEIATVRRWECSRIGHRWDVLEDWHGPVAVICSNCGERHPVERSDKKGES